MSTKTLADQALSLSQESASGSADEVSMGRIEQESWKQLLRYAYSLVQNWSEAEDITQETFVELFRANASGKPVEWIGAWTRTVSKRIAYRNYRERRPDLHVPLETEMGDGRYIVFDVPDTRYPSPEKQVIDQAIVRQSAKILSGFSDHERECVLMYFRGYDYAHIGSVLGISRWRARRMTLAAIKHVRDKLQPARGQWEQDT